MASGKVKFWSVDKAYGFIAPDSGGPDVFCHVRELRASIPPLDVLRQDQRVTYETKPGADGKGPKAVSVKLV